MHCSVTQTMECAISPVLATYSQWQMVTYSMVVKWRVIGKGVQNVHVFKARWSKIVNYSTKITILVILDTDGMGRLVYVFRNWSHLVFLYYNNKEQTWERISWQFFLLSHTWKNFKGEIKYILYTILPFFFRKIREVFHI